MHHADARTTMRDDMARAELDRHAAQAVAACLAGMAVGRDNPTRSVVWVRIGGPAQRNRKSHRRPGSTSIGQRGPVACASRRSAVSSVASSASASET